MRIVAIGANGRTGREVVRQALGHGHSVVAFARNPDSVEPEHERLVRARGDVRDLDSLRVALTDADAVICAIGDKPAGSVDTYSIGIGNIMQAMVESGVSRISVVSAAGTFARNDRNLSVGYRLMVRTVLRGLYDDLERMEQSIMASGLEWTIVRPAGLTDEPQSGHYRIGEHGRPLQAGSRIPRPDVAAFLLKAVTTDVWRRKAVTLAQ